VLPVKSVRDSAFLVQKVQHAVCIVLHSRCEDHNLIKLGHILQELVGSRPDQEVPLVAAHFKEMNQGFIQVKHQSVSLLSRPFTQCWQEWRKYHRQLLIEFVIQVVHMVPLNVLSLICLSLMHVTSKEL